MKPVALYTGNYTIGFLNSDKTLKVGEPLYTAPRELSDEEINTIREALLMIGFQDAFINYHLKEEALAILKKANEK